MLIACLAYLAPPAGKTFAGWGGGCSGTAPICGLNVIKDTLAQANFNK
jgi:hypothetical protein